jgi:hypothetical protein
MKRRAAGFAWCLPALALALPAGLGAAEDGGQAMAWTRLAVGARAASLGQAVSALDDDVFSTAQNPALLATQAQINVATQGGLLPDGRTLDFLGLARPVDSSKDWGWGGSWTYYADTTPYERRAGNTAVPDGTFGGDASLVQGGLGAWAWGRILALGADFKLYSQALDSSNANGAGFDAGAYCHPADWAGLALVLQDVGAHVGWSTGESEGMPPRLRLAGRFSALQGRAALSLEAWGETDQGPHVGAGMEWWALPASLAFRAGYQDGQFSLGLGGQGVFWGLQTRLDYAAGTDASASDQLQQRLSLTLGFDL